MPYFATGVPVAVERRQKRRDRKRDEDDVKAQVKARDGWECRWPRCEYRSVSQPLDAAHIEPSGMGGRPSLMRKDNLMAICRLHHRKAPISLHSGDLKIELLTSRGTDDVCAFYQLDRRTGELRHIATEKAIGVSVERSVR